MNRKSILIAGMLLTLLTAAFAVEVKDDKLYDRPVKVMENGLVRLAVTPGIGGRVLQFDLLNPHARSLQIHRHHIHFEPGDEWQGAEYGGLADMATTGWPGDIWGVTFDVDETEWEGNNALHLSAEKNGILHERRINILPNSSVMRYQSIQTNKSQATQDLTIRIHGEFAVGESADDADFIYFTNDKGLQVINYRLGWENPRFSYEKPGSWIACVDKAEKLALVRWFQPVTDDRVLVWHGHNEGPDVRDKKGGFYGVDRFMSGQTVGPGESAKATEEFAFIGGLTRVDFTLPEKYCAGALVLDQVAYGPQEEAVLTAVIGGGVEGEAYSVSLDVMVPNGGTKPIGVCQVPAYEAGKVASASLTFQPTMSMPIVATVKNSAGEEVAKFNRAISLDAQGYADANAALSDLMAVAENLKKAYAEKDLVESAHGESQMALMAHYLETVNSLMAHGKFADVQKKSGEYQAILQKAMDNLADASADADARQKMEKALAPLQND